MSLPHPVELQMGMSTGGAGDQQSYQVRPQPVAQEQEGGYDENDKGNQQLLVHSQEFITQRGLTEQRLDILRCQIFEKYTLSGDDLIHQFFLAFLQHQYLFFH